MPNNSKELFKDNNKESTDRITPIDKLKGALAVKSEDIQILDDRMAKYLKLQDEIREAITADSTDKDVLIDDVVDAVFKITRYPTWINVVTLGIVPIMNHRKRTKLRKVIESILKKIFDPFLGWYVMDYDDVKLICDDVGGKDYFTTQDHRAIYIAVIQKLEVGPLRDKCIKLGIVKFVQEKVIDIRNNFLTFKTREL